MTPAIKLLITLSALIVAMLGANFLWQHHVLRQLPEQPAREDSLPTFPAPDELPPVSLPNFRFQHPRLPAPSAEEIRILRRDNPQFISQHRARAKDGTGGTYSVMLTALLEPYTLDLADLHHRLISSQYGYRGNEVYQLAVAYDWLYPQWTASQRRDLAKHVLEGCRHVISVIRDQRLSPYNVFFYNRPFQSLIACSLALYGDLPEAGGIMSFAHDMLKKRTLPVWQQILGSNGGWHEGQYLNKSIGQAIYMVPAMWRSATGEDLFRGIAGIRGFLDFLIYRNRPDFTHFRWGDTAFFELEPPDRIPLALEFGHAPAYSFKRPPDKRPRPSARPWGPLTDSSLLDPTPLDELPWYRFFDGIGLLVARSDWSPDATYVTFKAGDNYWSHSHLDQGAFTIYKGGALAIDSGFYTKYGSDHHMNYFYQTIAHNTITVKDPADTVPALAREGPPRSFANDGGQRRIGSGWGIEPAPLDRDEWMEKKSTYHTGTMHKVEERHDIVAAVADVTPAYTNEWSGGGTFSHRTRLVERFWRSLIYDRVDDVIVIHDRVTATRPEFRKRWLLHSRQQPNFTSSRFVVRVDGDDRLGHAGGSLTGHVLLPGDARIDIVGGPGFEFFVDGRNYDSGKRHPVPSNGHHLYGVDHVVGVLERHGITDDRHVPAANVPGEHD